MVRRTETGDWKEAQYLLVTSRFCVDYGFTIPNEILEFMARAIGRLIRGESPKKALCLVRPRGHPEPDLKEIFRRLDLARAVRVARRSGDTFEKAVDKVAKVGSAPESAVRRYRKGDLPSLVSRRLGEALSSVASGWPREGQGACLPAPPC